MCVLDDENSLPKSVTVAAILEQGAELDLADLKAWAADRLSAYKIPKRLILVQDLPRNAMGKVMKPDVKKMCLKPRGIASTDDRQV